MLIIHYATNEEKENYNTSCFLFPSEMVFIQQNNMYRQKDIVIDRMVIETLEIIRFISKFVDPSALEIKCNENVFLDVPNTVKYFILY